MSCANHRMRNVILGIDAGQVTVTDPRVTPILADVPYIILEEADGDVRAAMASRLRAFDQAWAFRVLHGIANGLRQLHQAGISHQDLKPSNVMTIEAVAKIGDLGRAGVDGGGAPHDSLSIAGDPTYAPPELLYGEIQPDGRVRRRACDVYHLGSMLVFFYTGSGLTPLIETELAPTFHWRTWPGDFRNVLPYVRNAFDQIVDRLALAFPDNLRSELTILLRQLADPDPLLRGYGARSGISRYSMERYVSHFDRLARKAEWEIRKGSTP
jgi:serine/threonine protein kinase